MEIETVITDFHNRRIYLIPVEIFTLSLYQFQFLFAF